MEKVLYRAVFNRKKKLLPNGKALIQVEAYLNGKKKYFSTKIYITPGQWDKRHRTIKDHPNEITLNKQIRDFVSSLEDAELQQRQKGKQTTLEYLAEFLKGSLTSVFLDFCRQELKTSSLKASTRRDHETVFNYLKKFRPGTLIEEIDYNFLVDFELFLRKKELHTNTVAKNLGIVKKYVNQAINKDLLDLNKNPFRKFKLKKVKTERNYLTPEEIEIVEKLRLPKDMESYQLALDKYLFSLYTGLRFSDISALMPQSLVLEDGKEWLVLSTKKTDEPIRIPIHLLFEGRALDIFYNYVGSGITVFPFQYNHLLNDDLKKVMELAGIKKKITFHTARHTTATYLLYKGVNITTVQKLLGHRRLETTQIYGKVMDMTLINDLKNVSYSR